MNEHYEYPKVLNILKGFLEALRDELIINENHLLLYYNPEEVSSSFFKTLGRKLSDFHYTEEQTMKIMDTMNFMGMALEDNLQQAGMAAKNPTWYIYFSKVKFGYTEGRNDTMDKFTPSLESNLSEEEILELAEQKSKVLQIKGS